jgi:drug/metabolite transporter (DMT)-like permease
MKNVMEDKTSDHSAELLLLLVVIIWASNAPIAKFGISGLDVFVFNAIRYLVASIVLAGILLLRFEWRKVQRSDWLRMIGLGVLANVVYQVAYILGLKNTSVGNSVVLLSTSPLWTAYLESKILKQPVTRRTWLAMLLSFGGILLIIVGSGQKLGFGSRAMVGDVLSLFAAFLWALNTSFQKPFLKTYSALQLSVVLIGVGAVGLSLAAIPSALTIDWKKVGILNYGAAVASGALSIAAANVMWTFGVKKIGPRRTSVFNNLIPVLAIVLAYVLLGERISVWQFVGAGVTLTGVWFARR